MNLVEAHRKANHILDRERLVPTVYYQSEPVPPAMFGTRYELTPVQYNYVTDHRPRKVKQDCQAVEFKSESFDLLSALHSQLNGKDKPSFSANLAMRLGNSNSFHLKQGVKTGSATQASSELPVVAEFLVRNEYKPMFFRALGRAEISPALTLMLLELEDMISFNYMVLSDEEYGDLESTIRDLEIRITTFLKNPFPKPTLESNIFFHLQKELPPAVDNIKEMMGQARLAHIKKSTVIFKPAKVQSQSAPTVSAFMLNITPPKPSIPDVLPHLHKDLQGYGHYFSEKKYKEALTAAFGMVENRLNQIRDSSSESSVKTISGKSLVHALFKSGDMGIPYPSLSSGNQPAREAYLESIRNFISGSIGWFRNSYNHEAHNLPEPSDWETIELLFTASQLLRLIDLSVANGS